MLFPAPTFVSRPILSCRGVPIILRHCDRSDTPFSSIQGLPINTIPVKEWNDQDKAFLNVVDGIKVLLKSLSEFDFILEINGKNESSNLRKKVLSAKTLRELKEAEFESDEYEKLFPPTFEMSDLTHLIKRSIRYEEDKYKRACAYPQRMEMERMMYSIERQREKCIRKIVV